LEGVLRKLVEERSTSRRSVCESKQREGGQRKKVGKKVKKEPEKFKLTISVTRPPL
jgi:hypothetical protein